MKLIGISGEAGSGKNTLSAFLAEHLAAATEVCLGDLLRQEIERMGLSPDRQLQRIVANYKRKTLGGSYWLRKAIRLVDEKTATVLLTGIYAPEEVDFLHSQGGLLIWVEANPVLRMNRIKVRSDGSRDRMAIDDPENFHKNLECERGHALTEGNEVSLVYVKGMADCVIENNGNVDALRNQAENIVPIIEEKLIETAEGNLSLVKARRDIDYTAKPDWTDDPGELGRFLKAHFFEEFLGSSEAVIQGDTATVEFGMSLKKAVRALYKPNLKSITGNQVAKRIGDIFLIEDPSKALANLRRLTPSNQEEEYFAGLTDEEFFTMHLEVHLRWLNSQSMVLSKLPDILKTIKQTDKIQFSAKMDRSLNRIREEGVICHLMEEAFPKLRAMKSNPILEHRPVLEFVKNDRIFIVSGFKNAKASLVIHDVIDHLWTFSLLEDLGLFHKYHEMFASIGNPEKTDIFKREGEAVASISYGVRAFQGIHPGFNPLINTKDIVKKLRDMRGQYHDRHTEALRIINNIESNSSEWRSLGYVFSNYVTELDVQRRTYGCIKFKSPETNRISDELDSYSADYLCFFIEVHHELLKSSNKHRDTLFFTHYLLEEYLRGVMNGNSGTPGITLKPGILNGDALEYSRSVPPEASQWMFRNYGFTTNRNRL